MWGTLLATFRQMRKILEAFVITPTGKLVYRNKRIVGIIVDCFVNIGGDLLMS